MQGHVEDGWGEVADVFRGNFEGNPGEVGAACCVYVAGRPVVDLWGGLAAAGKAQIPVRWLLSHQAGLPIVDGPLTFEEACAWHPVIRALEAQKPLWQSGTEHVYHSMTFGFLVGEVVRRITGKSLGTFFAEEIAAPLGLSARIGLPEAQEGRVARLEYAAPFTMEEMTAGMLETTGLDEATVSAWMNAVWGPDSVQARAGTLGGALDPASGYMNTRAWRAAEFPAANMFTDARSLARMYAATVSEVDGVRLLDPTTVERMTVVQTDKTRMNGLPPGLDIPADRSFYMSLGFWRACEIRARLLQEPDRPVPVRGHASVRRSFEAHRRNPTPQAERARPARDAPNLRS